MSSSNGDSSFSRIKRFLTRRQSSRLGDKWIRSLDIFGHSKTFDIICNHCESEMMLRYTEIMPDRSRTYRIGEGVNNMAYKCPRCHVMYKFFIPDDTSYLNEIIAKKRDGIALYLPPKSEWENENKEIKKRLKALNYM